MMLAKEQKIIINCRFLTQPISGVQRFAIELCRELKKLRPNLIFVSPKNVMHKDIVRELEVLEIGRLRGHLWEQIELKLFVERNKGLLISLCNTAPLFVKKQIVTIHDLSFMHHPEWFSFKFRKVYNFLIPKITRRSLHIFTVSETSKKELIETLDIQSNKITVIYNAVAPIFQRPISEEPPQITKKEKYILTVSSHHPRKNFKKLVEAYLQLKRKDIKLVIAGNFNKHFKEENIASSDTILFKENVDDEALVELYSNAALFVYPSLYEGFGIPIIEAMSLGTPACISDIPVFREICGDNAVYFDPNSAQSIKEKIEYSLVNPMECNNDYLKQYNWKSSSKRVNEVISQIIKN